MNFVESVKDHPKEPVWIDQEQEHNTVAGPFICGSDPQNHIYQPCGMDEPKMYTWICVDVVMFTIYMYGYKDHMCKSDIIFVCKNRGN